MILETNETNTDPGTTVVLNYAILLGITATLVAFLLISVNTFVTNAEDRAIEAELQTSVETLASEIEQTDRALKNADSLATSTEYRYNPSSDSPIRNAEATYRVEPESGTNVYTLIADSENTDKQVRTRVRIISVGFNYQTVGNSSTLTIDFDPSEEELYFGSNRGDGEIETPDTIGDYTIPADTTVEDPIVSTGFVDGGSNSVVESYIIADDGINTDSGLTIQGFLESQSDIRVDNSTLVEGSVTSDEDVFVNQNSTIQNSIITTNLTLSSGSLVGVDIVTTQTANLGDSITVNGSITANQLTAGDDLRVGDSTSAGEVTAGDNSEFNGSVSSDTGIQVGDSTSFNSTISAENNIQIGNDSQGGRITEADQVSVGMNYTSNGDITTEDTVDIGESGVVNGDITSTTVTLNDDTTVNGEVLATDIICGNNVVINGQPCEDYDEEEPDTVIVTFQVTDSSTDSSIPDAEIEIDGDSITTDASGEVNKELDQETTYSYTANADGYDESSGSIMTGENDEAHEIQLSPQVSNPEISMSLLESGAQGNPDISVQWDVTDMPPGGSVEVLVDGTVIESGLTSSGQLNEITRQNQSDTVTVRVVDSIGNTIESEQRNTG